MPLPAISLMRRCAFALVAIFVSLGLNLGGTVGGSVAVAQTGSDPLVGSRLLHYRVKCHDGERCKLECYQGGRIVVSRARLDPGDRVTLVMTDGFSDRLQPLWLEVIPADTRSNKRTILLPRDVLCDFQGLTVQPFTGS